MVDLKSKLRIEYSKNTSGKIQGNKILKLKEKHYYVKDVELDGDAPKQLIKGYFFEPDSGVIKSNPKSWPAYIAKSAEKWYPHESVTEYMINRIGEELGLIMNKTKLVIINTQIRFLSKYFLGKNERLIHGAEICGEYLEDTEMADVIAKKKSTARDFFTFQFIRDAIKAVFPKCHDDIIYDLVKLITFDGLVGNNDRHFYNWGVIDNKVKGKQLPKFAPIFDSARGLLWNEKDEILKNHQQHLSIDGKKIVNYIENACPRISLEGNKNANHFELIAFIKGDNNLYEKIVTHLSAPEKEHKILLMLRKEFFPLFISERKTLIEYILHNRFKKIREL